MGTTAGDRMLEIEYPLAFGRAFEQVLREQKKRFRYVHLSGATTERDQSKALYFKSEMRKIKVLPFPFLLLLLLLLHLFASPAYLMPPPRERQKPTLSPSLLTR
jgi:hypothetical protein